MEDLDISYYFRLYCSHALEEIQEIEKAKGEEECEAQTFFDEDNQIFKVLVNEKKVGMVALHEFRVFQCFNATFFAHYLFHHLPDVEVIYVNSCIERLDGRMKRLLEQYENEF